MLDAVVAAAFEDMQEAGEVGIDISVRVVERVADPGLRGEMDRRASAVSAAKVASTAVRSPRSALMKRKPFALLEPREARLLQRHVVIGVEIVEADHLVAAVEQPCRRVIADKAGGAGNQDPHRATTSPLCLEARARRAIDLACMSIGTKRPGTAVSRCG